MPKKDKKLTDWELRRAAARERDAIQDGIRKRHLNGKVHSTELYNRPHWFAAYRKKEEIIPKEEILKTAKMKEAYERSERMVDPPPGAPAWNDNLVESYETLIPEHPEIPPWFRVNVKGNMANFYPASLNFLDPRYHAGRVLVKLHDLEKMSDEERINLFLYGTSEKN